MPPLSTSEEERARKYEALDIDSILHQAKRWMQHVKSAEQLAQEAGY